MVTLIRFIVLKQKEIKYKLAFWQFVDKELTTLMKNPEEIEKKILPYLAQIIHSSTQSQKTEDK